MRFNQLLIISILILFLSTVFSCAENQSNIPERDGPFTVVKVIDGDTIVLLINNQKIKVRLIGVDTPETVHPKKSVEAYGREASEFTKNLLKGEQVTLEYEPGPSKLDKYKRLLAYVYRYPDGLFVNLEIVRQGYGHAYTRYPFQYIEKFRSYEKEAREAGKGLWGLRVSRKLSLESKEKNIVNDKKQVTVYIARTGTKYHKANCRFLSKSKIPIALSEAKVRYGPCSSCRPPR